MKGMEGHTRGGIKSLQMNNHSHPLMNICNSDEWMKGVITTNGTSRHLLHTQMYPINRSNLSMCHH